MSVDVRGEVMLDLSDARRQTDEAKESAEVLRRRLVDLYNGGAHTALGYESWHSYCEGEFGMDRNVGQRWLDAGRVDGALSALASERGTPNLKVASEVLGQLLPPANTKSGNAGRNGSAEQVAAAWDKIVEAKRSSDDADTPITAVFAKRVLVKAGDLPDTRGAYGKPGWHELLGEVGDSLVKAQKQVGKVEGELTRKPSAEFLAKAERYASWADDIAGRLRSLGQPDSA